MPPVTSRKIFIWSLPALFLFSFLWYKRKKSFLRSDPGGTDSKPRQCTDKTITAETNSVLVTRVAEDNTSQEVILVEESAATPASSSEESVLVIVLGDDSLTQTAETVLENEPLIIDISSSLSELEDSISVEYIGEVENTPVNFARPLNPDTADSLVQLDSIVTDSVGNQPPTLTDLDSDTSAFCSDLEYCDKIPKDELIGEEGLVIPTIVSTTNTSEVDPKEQEVDIKEEKNRSWAEECELESEDKGVKMAREVSSNITLEVSNDSSPLEVEVASLESKLSSLKMQAAVVHGAVAAVKEGHAAERDSANHSPAEVMLGSPSPSNYSDSQSEGSSDSGKGCSDVVTPPSRTPASGSSVSGDLPVTTVYEFVLPQFLVGRLIGRHGVFVHQIKAKTHANILIKRHPNTNKVKICAVEGTPIDIESALEMIRQKFPLKRYPTVTLEQIQAPTACPLMSENFQLQLVEGVNNDVILSSLVSPAHFFLQQPTHPTFPSLNRLNVCMNICYNEPLAPALPTPIADSVICVAPTMGGWYRAQVIRSYADSDMSHIKFIDYGGFIDVDNAMLRQIRSDFISLPFQAAECYLANVKPVGGVWACEAMAVVEELTQGQVIQAQIHGYADDGVPVVYLFSIQGTQVLVVNRELVLRGYAEWDEPTGEVDSAPEIQA